MFRDEDARLGSNAVIQRSGQNLWLHFAQCMHDSRTSSGSWDSIAS
jgi:hypothetical protein